MKYILATTLFFITFFVTAKTLVPTVAIDTILSNENVTYKVTQDENNIYLNVSTSDKKTMMSMVRLGVTVFFDIKGRKKKNVYVKYPSETIVPADGRNSGERNIRVKIQDEQRNTDRIKKILANEYSQKAEYRYFDELQEFNILLNNLGIEAAFTYDDSAKSLAYDLTIPKIQINTNTKKDLSKLTIGVETIKEKEKTSKRDGPSGGIGGMNIGGQQGRGQGRGGISGGRGGPGGGASRGGQGGGRPSSQGQARSAEVFLDFWFDFNEGG